MVLRVLLALLGAIITNVDAEFGEVAEAGGIGCCVLGERLAKREHRRDGAVAIFEARVAAGQHIDAVGGADFAMADAVDCGIDEGAARLLRRIWGGSALHFVVIVFAFSAGGA